MFLLLINSNESIFLALNLCNYFNNNELSAINDILLNLFDKTLNSNKIRLLNAIIRYVPSIIKMRKFDSILLLTKELENYYNNKTDKDESFEVICRLLNALAPDRFNSTTLSSVIDSSTLIPSFIRETGKEFWDIYEKNMKLINEKLNENPFLLNDELSFLLNYPEIVDFKVRSSYFKKKMMNRIDEEEFKFSIDFDNLLESSFQRLHNEEPNNLLKKFRIEVVNSIVVDVGGVTRSWFTSLAKELFNQNYGIFDCSKNMRGYKPSCNSSIHPDHLEYFKFAGMFIARALIEGISIDAHLTSSFCKQILHRKTCLKDLEDIDEDMYRSLNLILENDANELYLTFSINIDNFGEIKTIELKENGSEIPVTNDNKVEFVNLRTNYILTDQIKDQLNAFNNGFDSLIPHEFLRIFTPSELDLLICGVHSIDVNDFRDNMTYIPPYNKDTLVVKLFFEVIQNWENDDLAKLLLFMTGSSRVPVNGFKEFADITGEKLKIGPGGKRENWPQSHTCFNELDLPEYQTKEELETKLRRSMEYYNTFGVI